MDDLSHIAEPLRGLAVPISSLVPDAANVREHGDRNLTAIQRSLGRFGQRLPLVVQKDGMVVRAGNGRLAAAEALGWSHIAAVVVDEPNVEAVAFAIADNRTAELATWDWEGLESTIAAIKTDAPDFDLSDIGWTEDELEGMGLAGEWDPHEDHLTGTSENLGGGGVKIAFTEEQASEVEMAVRALDLGDELTADAVVLLARHRSSQP